MNPYHFVSKSFSYKNLKLSLIKNDVEFKKSDEVVLVSTDKNKRVELKRISQPRANPINFHMNPHAK